MEKFDLSIWLKDKNRKVVTRDGKPVRIVCWDKLGYYHIIGCIRYSDNCEEIETYNIDGSKYSLNEEDPNDLFFADEEENLSEEKIRKDIVAAVETYGDFTQGRKEEIYTWLKKQGEQMSDPRHGILNKLIEADNIHQMSINDAMIEEAKDKAIEALSKLGISKLLGIEKQGEQKLTYDTYEVKPKFNVGDWIISNKHPNCDNSLMRIVEVRLTDYLCQYYNGQTTYCHEFIDKSYHLWTIQDANDGDVLAYPDGTIVIFKYRLDGLNSGIYMSYVLLSTEIETRQSCAVSKDIHPATKEQRDVLFQKMHEAGYEWDAERKELKKIEQKSAEWSEEDKEMLKDIISGLKAQKSLTFAHDNQGNAQMNARIDWLQSLPEKFVLEPKQEWSEEDEETLNIIANHIRNDGRYSSPILANKYADFILSIKPKNKWKPSEEQMKWLKDVIETVPMTCRQQLPLESLYNDLKKL